VFTGIVEEMGTVRETWRRADILVVRLRASRVLPGLASGSSIAVSGCCLTAVEVDQDGFTCELTPETLARTAFEERLVPGASVNLERPMRADGRFDGHIVQGHVDGTGTVLSLTLTGDSGTLEIAPESGLERYLVKKGSVAVDGVSLTVADLKPGAFVVALIPYTLEHTTLGEARAGAGVNLEADVVAKYVERLLASPTRG
jgi:riboflavin synthase